ncbi:MAG: TolC family protein [Balneolaceae bacterium]
MKKTILAVLCAVLLSSGTILGQSAQTITLEQAIQISLENNFLLEQAENNLELADLRITSEQADFLPNISSSMSYSRTGGQQFVADILSFDNVTSQNVSGRLDANITIFDGFENILSLRQSQYDKTSSEENLARARENVIFNTATAYLTVLVNMELLEIAQENLESSNIQLNQTQAEVEVGARAAVDQFNQEATVATNELTVIQRENDLRISEVQLVNRLQIDPRREYEFVVPEISDAFELAGEANYSLSALIDEALLNRSDIKSEEASIASQKLGLEISRGSLLPSLTAGASISTRYSDPYFIPDASFSDQFFDQQVNKGVGVTLSLPIFQNWNRMYNIELNKVQLKNAELDLENTKLTVIQEVTQAYNDFIAYSKQLESAEKALVASEKALETQQERYNVGASTLIELSQAQATFVSSRSDFTQAQYNLIFQNKLLDFYLGKLSGENIEF